MHKKIFIKIKVKLTYNKEKCFKLKKMDTKSFGTSLMSLADYFLYGLIENLILGKKQEKKSWKFREKNFFRFF